MVHPIPETHQKLINELLTKADELNCQIQEEADTLSRTIPLKDLFGVKMLALSLQEKANKLAWIAAKLRAIVDVSYL